MTYNKKTIEDIDVKGKKIIARCDFNVPMKDGEITDTKRIVGALPTIQYLLKQGAAVILCSHLGRPHNVFNEKLKLDKKEKKNLSALFGILLAVPVLLVVVPLLIKSDAAFEGVVRNLTRNIGDFVFEV